ncbi:MFS transporter [Bacillus sp. V2I10]|uniref:MFS transporter n=1 Tax=Bacillus sp. V2I10 TaxID=3042276 RepID=UPI00277FD6DA|nr:MFS transporter [Bacillus sp. V2I10]MDQ0859996.1 GPH family glycoside/pentoside/hexuronide:cation symporter [Bacillus sp. V2I10]
MSYQVQANETSSATQSSSLVQDIKLGEKIGYGFGDLASNLVWSSMSMFIVFFYTDVIGIGASIIGTIMLFSRFFDGITDLVMGAVIDKTKSKHGKARPWILWTAVPFAITTALLYAVPDIGEVGQIVYIVLTYNLLTLLYTAINIPYGVLNSLITQDQYQRSLLNVFRTIFAMIGVIIVSTVTMPLVNLLGGGQSGWVYTFVIYGALGALLFLITFNKTKERVKPAVTSGPNSKVPLKKGLKALLKNKYWFVALVFFLTTYLGTALFQGSTIYFAQYILGSPELVGLLTVASIVPTLVGLLMVAPLIKKFGKRNSMVGGLILTVVGSLIIVLDPNSLLMVVIGSIMRGIGTAPVLGSKFAMLADTIEYGEWKSGIRTEGLVYSAGSMGSKVGTGLGVALIGWTLAWGGYMGGEAVQTDSALFSIYVLFIYLPILISVIQIMLLGLYKLDKQYPQIVKELHERANE